MRIAFFTFITDNYRNTNIDFQSFWKSFKYFHPEIDLIVFEQPTIEKLFNEKPWLNSTNCKASFAKLILKIFSIRTILIGNSITYACKTFVVGL